MSINQKDLENKLKKVGLLDQYKKIKQLKNTDKDTYDNVNSLIKELVESLVNMSNEFIELYNISQEQNAELEYYQDDILGSAEPSEYLM